MEQQQILIASSANYPLVYMGTFAHPRDVLLAFIILGLCSLVMILFNRCWRQPMAARRRFQQQGLKVHPYKPVVGNALEIIRMIEAVKMADLDSPSNHDILRRVMPFHSAISPTYGKKYVYWWGTVPTLIVANPEDVKDIMSTNFKHYKKTQAGFQVLEKIFGNGLLSAVGEDWEKQRRILSPAFFTDKLKAMVADMAASAADLSANWEKIVKEGGGSAEIEVASDLKNVTADIIARTCFGSSYEKGKEVFENQTLLQDSIFQDILINAIVPVYRFLPTPTNLKCWKLERSIEKDLREIVEARRDLMRRKGASSCGVDLLGLILAGTENPQNKDGTKKENVSLSTQEVMDECKTFFIAGHETTATLLSWTMLLLALSPEWQERSRTEVLEICGKEAEPQADQLNKLRIVGMVLNETLRLYPPVAELIAREPATKEQDLKMNGLSVLQGMSFSILVAAIHRDKEQWGEDADEFKPERFADGVAKACKHPYAFIPFAAGPRNCIGQTFAMMEAKVVLATILQRFSFRVSPSYKHAPVGGITMKPSHGLQLIVERREP